MRFVFGLLILGIGGLALVAFAQKPVPTGTMPVLDVPNFSYNIKPHRLIDSIQAYVVVDAETGEILLEKNSRESLPTASVIKLIIAGALLQNETLLKATTSITTEDLNTPEEFGKLSYGQVYTVRDLLFPYLLESSNDAGSVLQRVWGAEVKVLLQDLYARHHILSAIPVEFSGLDSATKLSAVEVAILTRSLFKNTPTLFDITTLPRFQNQYVILGNNNPLSSSVGFLGGKHGYTTVAKKTFVVVKKHEFSDGDRNLIVVALGANDYEAAYAEIVKNINETISRNPASTSAIISLSTI